MVVRPMHLRDEKVSTDPLYAEKTVSHKPQALFYFFFFFFFFGKLELGEANCKPLHYFPTLLHLRNFQLRPPSSSQSL
jgi:hypothetical protein